MPFSLIRLNRKIHFYRFERTNINLLIIIIQILDQNLRHSKNQLPLTLLSVNFATFKNFPDKNKNYRWARKQLSEDAYQYQVSKLIHVQIDVATAQVSLLANSIGVVPVWFSPCEAPRGSNLRAQYTLN